MPVPVLADLEPTLLDSAGEVAITRLPDLEPTSEQSAGAALVGDVVEGFEATATAPVTVEVQALDVERSTQDPVPDDPWDDRLSVTCRYCLTPAALGQRLCGRCGMRLPLVRPPATASASEARPCGDCGIPMTGAQCPACGARR